MLVLSDVYAKTIYGFGIRKVRDNQEFFDVYLRNPNTSTFRRVDSDDINHVFSNIIISDFEKTRLDYTLADFNRTYQNLGIKIVEGEIQLPPREEYEIEEIKII